MKKKTIGTIAAAALILLLLALLFLPEYGQEMSIHGTYISQDENYIKLYRGGTYQFVDIRELTDLPEMRTGDSLTVIYRNGGAFELNRWSYLDRQQGAPIVATDLKISISMGKIYIKPANVTPTGLQLQMGVLDDRLTDLAVSTAFRLERKNARGWTGISKWSTASALTESEWIAFQEGDCIEYNWENICGALKPGTYRIYVRIGCSDRSHSDCATFTID